MFSVAIRPYLPVVAIRRATAAAWLTARPGDRCPRPQHAGWLTVIPPGVTAVTGAVYAVTLSPVSSDSVNGE